MLKLGYHLRTLSFKFSFSVYSLFKLNLFPYYLKSVQIRGYFWSIFSCIRTEYGDLRNNSVFGQLSRSVLFLHLFLMAAIFQWILYLKITFMVGCLIVFTIDSTFEYLELTRFCTVVDMKLYKDSALSKPIWHFHLNKLCP